MLIKHIHTRTKVHDNLNRHSSIAQPFGSYNTMIAISKQSFVLDNGKLDGSKSMLTYIVCHFLYIVRFHKWQMRHRSFVTFEFAVVPEYINGDVSQSFVNHVSSLLQLCNGIVQTLYLRRQTSFLHAHARIRNYDTSHLHHVTSHIGIALPIFLAKSLT